MDAQYSQWVSRWQAALDACERKGGKQGKISIGPPATLEGVIEVEGAFGQPLPPSFRKVLLDFSAEVEVNWWFRDDIQPPEPYQEIFCGDCTWSLARMSDIAHWYQEWLKVLDINNPYDRVWYGKLAFAEVGNGDNLAFDAERAEDAPVIYLSHDGGKGHGHRLGDNFIDFVERYSLLGCPGYEDWQMMPFLPDATSGLDAYGVNAQKWREWFGLDFEVNA